MTTQKTPRAKPARKTHFQVLANGLEQLKKRPIVVILILLGTASLSAVKWGNEIFDTSKNLGEKLGLIKTAEERSKSRLAYQLGKAIAWRSFYVTETQSATARPDEPEDFRAMVKNNLAELRSLCKKLDLPIEPEDQDFSSAVLGDYQQSLAATYYVNSIAAQHRPSVESALQLGLEIEGSFWMAQRRKFVYSIMESGFPAVETLAAINSKAQALGAKPVPVAGLDTDEVEALNREMQLLLRELDNNVSRVL
jgi:hypothetical protein